MILKSDRKWLQIHREAALATFYTSPDPKRAWGQKGKGIKDGAGIYKTKCNDKDSMQSKRDKMEISFP